MSFAPSTSVVVLCRTLVAPVCFASRQKRWSCETRDSHGEDKVKSGEKDRKAEIETVEDVLCIVLNQRFAENGVPRQRSPVVEERTDCCRG
jgi:hypothetical protein